MDLLRFRMAIEFAVGYPKWPRNTHEARYKDVQVARLIEDISLKANAVAPALNKGMNAIYKKKGGVGETARERNLPRQSHASRFPLISDRNDWMAINSNVLSPASLPNALDFEDVILLTPVLDASTTSMHLISSVCEMILKEYNVFVSKDFVMEIRVYRTMCRPFENSDIANFLAVVWTFEHLLDTLHAKPTQSAALSGSWLLQESLHARSLLHDQYNINPKPASWPSYDPYTSKEELERVLSCRDLQETIHITSGPDGLTRQKYGYCDSPIPFIRFSQHESTLDSTRITNWLKVCLGLVMFSDNDNPNTNPGNYLRWALDKPDYTVLDLLQQIGLSELAEFYGITK